MVTHLKIKKVHKTVPSSLSRRPLYLAGYFFFSLIVTCAFTFIFMKWGPLMYKNLNQLFKKSVINYEYINRMTIDPVMVKELIDVNDPHFAVIDIRSKEEYDRSHIKLSFNMPVYADYRHVYTTQTNKQELFNKIKNNLQNKKMVVVYGYAPQADTTLDAVTFLSKQNLKVRTMNIGWNEWKNNFYNWLPGAEMQGFSINTYLEGKDVVKTGGLPTL